MKTWAGCAMMSACLVGAAPMRAGNESIPVADPVLERPTLHSLGAYWLIRGDVNQNATVRVDYRKTEGGDWRQGPPLFRVEKHAHLSEADGSKVNVPDDTWLLAGSILLLQPDTEYEMKLSLSDPDGGEATRTLSARTIAEPVAPKGPRYHVVPGNGGGSGTPADPFMGIAAAERNAQPGDTMLLHAGVYQGEVVLRKTGERGKPIVWRAAGDGEVILDGKGNATERPERGISASGLTDIWFEHLTIRNARHAIVAHEAARLVVRRCNIHDVEFGITATRNTRDAMVDFFITDNVLVGPSSWPRRQGIEDARGIQVSGAGHVIAYNRIRGFADGIDTFNSPRCESIDIHNNEVSEMTDDGIETDYSFRNTRVFRNRLTNVYQGISTQPVYGGPIYIFRNVMYNVVVEPFKMHNGPSGAIIIHNTSVKKGMPLLLWTSRPLSNCVYRNNLFVGTDGDYAFDCDAPAINCDYDFDGFVGGPFASFLKWNKVKYHTFDEMRSMAPIERNSVYMPSGKVFASGAAPPEHTDAQLAAADLRLEPGTPLVDAGQPLPGFNDGFAGSAPDLGAYELGAALPQYGPRPE
jgi:hypothetical protein